MDGSALFELSYGLYVTGVKNGEGYAGALIDALVQATTESPPHIIICGMNGNNSTALIRENGEFTISVLGKDVEPFVIANFGFQSSRSVDKWANVEHEIKDGLPVLSHAVAYLRCRVEDIRIMATHHIFTCKVEDAWQGSGEPLLYNDYRKDLKEAVAAAFVKYKTSGNPPVQTVPAKREEPSKNKKSEQWVCTLCGYIYDGEFPFEKLPEGWTCPRCGAPKSAFEKQWI